MFYKWRDKLLTVGRNGLEYGTSDRKVKILKDKIAKLERIIGKQAVQIEILKNRIVRRDWFRIAEDLRTEGYKVKDICENLGINRSRYDRERAKQGKSRDFHRSKLVSSSDRTLLELIRKLKTKHPFLGMPKSLGSPKNSDWA